VVPAVADPLAVLPLVALPAGVPVAVVLVELGGVVLTGVDDGVPAVEAGAFGSAVGVLPAEPGVDAEPEVGDVPLGGVVGSTRLGGVPGPNSVLQWSGFSVSVSVSGAVLTLDRGW
jgi:hypothetical protein